MHPNTINEILLDVFTLPFIFLVCVCVNLMFPDQSQLLCLFLLLSQQVGETFFFFSVFIQLVASLSRPVISSVEHRSS